MSHFPEPVCTEQGIDSLLLPPDTLVAPPMELVVMDTAERHGETITDLAANCPAIGEFDVVGSDGVTLSQDSVYQVERPPPCRVR